MLESSRTCEAFHEAEAWTPLRRLWLATGNRAEAEELMQDAFLSVSDGIRDGRQCSTASRSGRVVLYTMNLDGSDARELTPDSMEAGSPRGRRTVAA